MQDTTVREGTEFASSDEVLSFLGVDRCRLVFRLRRQKNLRKHGERANDRAKGSSLFLLDYDPGKPHPTVHEYPDDPIYKSFNPLLSPDGSRILYNHTFDATDMQILPVDGGPPVKIAEGANPRWCRDETSGNIYVVYRTRNAMFQNVPQDGLTFRVQIGPDNQPVGEPEMVAAHGFGGGMSTNGRYLCSAFLLTVAMDRHTGAISAPFGTVLCEPDHENQCCRPSIAPDASGRMMVLRAPHSRFTTMGWDGSGLNHFPIPDGVVEWQTPEWSTHPDFATGSVMNNEFIYDIVLVRLVDKKYLQITTEGGYVHAHMWVGCEGN